MRHPYAPVLIAACLLASAPAGAQSANNLVALRGLAPVATLPHSQAGNAALAANYVVTGGIQTGAIRQATLLPLAEQRQQALRDAFITGGNFADLADGLGTSLGSAYLARAHYVDRERFTSVSQTLADLIAYTDATTGSDSHAGKFLFANATTNGKTPVSNEAAAILRDNGGMTDVFGRQYGHPAGGPGADAYGNSRPFQTERSVTPITGPDYFNTPSDTTTYSRGPIMNLIDSPSYPSGHTTYGYAGSLLLAVLVPQRYQQMMARAAEYGNDRILVGAHYAMDVLGGRTLATYDVAHLLANDPAYMDQTLGAAPVITNYQSAVKAARADLDALFQAACGKPAAQCALEDTGRFSNSAMNEAFYADTQTYGLPVVYPANAGKLEDIGQIAHEAGFLLTAAFPSLTLDEADQILTDTEGPGGGFLDDGSAFGAYSRLDLYAAAGEAARRAAAK